MKPSQLSQKLGVALFTLSLFSINSFAADDYKKYEKAVSSAQTKAEKSLKTKDSKKIASAYYQLASIQNEARKKGFDCGFGTVAEVVSNLQVVVDHSPWFQKTLPTLEVYQNFYKDSLNLQLAAAGLVKGKPMLRADFVQALQNIFNNSEVTLFKPQPGISPVGNIHFEKGQAVETWHYLQEDGNLETVKAGPVPVEVKVSNEVVTIYMDGAARYQVEVGNDAVFNEIHSNDQIFIKGENSNNDITDQLELAPDECSA